MKFFSKYKKQIFSVFLCVALFSCFLCFSFSSSADVVNDVTEMPVYNIYFQRLSGADIDWSYSFNNMGNGDWVFDTSLPFDQATPLFSRMTFDFDQDYSIPAYSGRPISLSLNLDFSVTETDYLTIIPDDVDISDSAIFTSAYCVLYFSDGTNVTLHQDTFILKDDDIGVIVDPSSDVYWNSIKGNIMNLSVYALFDVSAYYGKTITRTYFSFPDPGGTIYYSNESLSTFLTVADVSAFYDFAYTPFNDVVQDDLSDIKGSLSGVNNKLDSLNSTMNTIDQDINRVNQKLDQTNETLGSIDQSIKDILKPSTPAVDFKNQWNDYFENNPIPDLSTLPLYDMSNLMTLLADSSQVIRGIFSPFFLRDYQVTVPLINGFSNIKLDPVATYVSLSFALSLSILIIGILKGSRG